jgi:hypothetical protein
MGHSKTLILYVAHYTHWFSLVDTVKFWFCLAHTANNKKGLSSLGGERGYGKMTILPLVYSVGVFYT